jgi:hypothetical protein
MCEHWFLCSLWWCDVGCYFRPVSVAEIFDLSHGMVVLIQAVVFHLYQFDERIEFFFENRIDFVEYTVKQVSGRFAFGVFAGLFVGQQSQP